MLARYSAEQDEFFPENEAAVYYRSPAELDDKIALGVARSRVARAHPAQWGAAGGGANLRCARGNVLRECGLNSSPNSNLANPDSSLTPGA